MITTKEFNLNQDIVNIQINLLLDFTHSLAYYRAINQDLSRAQRNTPFWIYTMNTHYFRAITDWCIVFGADSNEAHWKNVSEDVKEKIKSEIRPRILAAANFTCAEWGSYHKKIKDFRNDYAAHRNVNPNDDSVPSLDKAFEIAKSYFEWLRELLSIPNHELKTLDDFFPEFQIEVLDVLANDLRR